MPTLSYVISSVLLISPFIAAGILSEAVDNESIGLRQSNYYVQWLVLLLCAVSGIVIFRILVKELTIASLIEGAKLIRLGRKGVTLDQSESSYSLARFVTMAANIPGYCFSYLFFPNSNIGYYLGVIVFYVLIIIFTLQSFDLLRESGEITRSEKDTYSYSIIFGSLFVFLALRFFSDSRSFEAARLTSEAARYARDYSLLELADGDRRVGGAGTRTGTTPVRRPAGAPPIPRPRLGTIPGAQNVLTELARTENRF